MPEYRTAVCNVAYISRDSDVADRCGRMPAAFAERRYEFCAMGMMVPAKVPLWTTDPYRIWSEADDAPLATGDPTAVSAWHVVGEIPVGVPAARWTWMVTGFLQRELVDQGAAVAWATYALQGKMSSG